MALAVVQAARAATAGSSSAQPVFGSTCTAGNLWIAISSGATSAMQSTPSVSNGGWTRLGGAADGSGNGEQTEVWSLTATATTTPPQIQSGTFNLDRNVVGIWEISGGAVLDQLVAGDVSSAGGTTSNLTTGAANTLCLIGEAARFEDPAITAGGWNIDFATGTGDTIIGGNQAVASSGATVNATIAASGFANTGYAMVSLKSGSSTETANPVKLALSGISFNGGGARTETANPVTLALGGVKFNGAAQFIAEVGSVALVLNGVAFKINSVDVTAEPTLVSFAIF